MIDTITIASLLAFAAIVFLCGWFQAKNLDVYAIVVYIVFATQVVLSFVYFANTIGFALAAIYTALLVWFHHMLIHRKTVFENDEWTCLTFQLKDITNHETWVVAAIVAAIVNLASPEC